MSKSKHTPGPWYQAIIDHRRWVSQQPEGGTYWIAEVASGVIGDEEEANARLIAAAPDLFDALVECERDLSKAVAIMPRRYCNQKDNQRCEELLEMVRAAIAKASLEPEVPVRLLEIRLGKTDKKPTG